MKSEFKYSFEFRGKMVLAGLRWVSGKMNDPEDPFTLEATSYEWLNSGQEILGKTEDDVDDTFMEIMNTNEFWSDIEKQMSEGQNVY